MASKTHYLEKKVLDHVLGIATFVPAANLYLLLLTGDPTKSGSFANEISAGGYARLLITGSMSATDITTGQSTNTAVLNIGPASADWGTVTHAAVADSITIGAGNMYYFQSLDEAETIDTGGEFQLTPSQMVLREI